MAESLAFQHLPCDVLTVVLSYLVDEYELVFNLTSKRFRSCSRPSKKRKHEKEFLSCRLPYCERVSLVDWAINTCHMPRGILGPGNIEYLSDLACRNKSQDFAVLEHLFSNWHPLEGDLSCGDGRHNYVKICHAAALGRVDLLENLKGLIERVWDTRSSWFGWEDCMRLRASHACALAALGGHLRALQWLKAKGCIWNRWTCKAATLSGSEELQLWVRTQQVYDKCCSCTSLEDKCQIRAMRGWPIYGCKPHVMTERRGSLYRTDCIHYPSDLIPLVPLCDHILLPCVLMETWHPSIYCTCDSSLCASDASDCDSSDCDSKTCE